MQGTRDSAHGPRQIEHRRPAQRGSTVPREQLSPIKECGTPVATAPPQTVSHLQPFVATDWDDPLRPRVGEGRNTMLRRDRCVVPDDISVGLVYGRS